MANDLLMGKPVRRPHFKLDDNTLGGSQMSSMIIDCTVIPPEERKTIRQLKNYLTMVLKIK